MAVSFARDKFCATYLQKLAVVDLFESSKEIRPPGRDDWLNRHESSNDAFALGDLDLLTLAQ
jgi:hypothetical protein